MRIEYTETKKINRKFSPEWAVSGKVDLSKMLPRYINHLLTERSSMVEYIEELHDEIDRLQGQIKANMDKQKDKNA